MYSSAATRSQIFALGDALIGGLDLGRGTQGEKGIHHRLTDTMFFVGGG